MNALQEYTDLLQEGIDLYAEATEELKMECERCKIELKNSPVFEVEYTGKQVKVCKDCYFEIRILNKKRFDRLNNNGNN